MDDFVHTDIGMSNVQATSQHPVKFDSFTTAHCREQEQICVSAKCLAGVRGSTVTLPKVTELYKAHLCAKAGQRIPDRSDTAGMTETET